MRYAQQLKILALTTFLACGDDPEPVPSSPPASAGGPSVADLLAATAEEQKSPQPTEQAAPSPPPNEPEPQAATGENTAQALPPSERDCSEAREKLKAAQGRLDRARERSITPLQEAASTAQIKFENCMVAGKSCTDNASKFKRLLEQRDATAAKVTAALDKISAQEAGLFPLSQAVDRACN